MLLTEQRVGSGVAELGIGPVDGPAHEGRLAAWVRFASRQLGLQPARDLGGLASTLFPRRLPERLVVGRVSLMLLLLL